MHTPVRCRDGERQPPRMQGLPAQSAKRLAERGRCAGRRGRPSAVLRIPDYGKAEVGEVDPDLMRASGVEPDRERGMGAIAGLDLDSG